MNPTYTFILSWPHAIKMMKKLLQKKNREAGYSFELFDPGCQLYDKGMPKGVVFAEYSSNTEVVQLKIFYEKP